jgi:hypothetical protein
MMDTVNTSDTSVNFLGTTRRNIPEECDFHTRRLENLKSQISCFLWNQNFHCLFTSSLYWILYWASLIHTKTSHHMIKLLMAFSYFHAFFIPPSSSVVCLIIFSERRKSWNFLLFTNLHPSLSSEIYKIIISYYQNILCYNRTVST